MVNFWTVSSDVFLEKIWKENTILLDIRTDQEKIEYWYIENTDLFLDMYSANFWDDILELDKSKLYLIYCWHANRSAFLLNFMMDNWFKSVYELEWGIDLWWKEWKIIKK